MYDLYCIHQFLVYLLFTSAQKSAFSPNADTEFLQTACDNDAPLLPRAAYRNTGTGRLKSILLGSLKSGQPFTVSEYFKEKGTHPVRVYLTTTCKEENSNGRKATSAQGGKDDDSEDDLPTFLPPCKTAFDLYIQRETPSSVPLDLQPTPLPAEINVTVPSLSANAASCSVPQDLGVNISDAQQKRPLMMTDILQSREPASEMSTQLLDSSEEIAAGQHSVSGGFANLDAGFPDDSLSDIDTCTSELIGDIFTSSATTPTQQPVRDTTQDPSLFSNTDTPSVMFRRQERTDDEMLLQKAAQASLGIDSEPLTMELLLKQWIDGLTLESECPTTLVIHRKNLWQSAGREIRRKRFTFFSPVNVVFSDELGDDFGGPRREFLRELMRFIATRFFEGSPTDGMIFRHNVSGVENKDHHLIGKLVSWSILQGGPGLPVLDKNLFQLMFDQPDVDVTESLHSLLDSETRCMIEKVIESQSLEEVQSDEKLLSFIYNAGITPPLVDKKALKSELVKHFLFYRTHAEETQFLHGLNEIGNFADMCRNFPQTLMPLFVNLN